MIVLLIILVSLFQVGDSPTKWQCAKNCEPPGKDVTLLKGREMTERVVTCETPKLPNLLDAKGTVLVQVLVDETGNVSCVRAINSSLSLIEGPALEAAKKWKFKPLVVDQKPKPYTGLVYVYASWDVDEMKKHCQTATGRTNRWTRAAGACFVTGLVRRREL
jgi:TonB family protein